MQDKLSNYRDNWKTHLERMTEERIPKQIVQCQPRAVSRAVSHRPLTAEARVRTHVNPCGNCGGQSGTETGFSPSSSVFPCQYHSTVALQTYIIWGMRNMVT
jgi:hypothetical protein